MGTAWGRRGGRRVGGVQQRGGDVGTVTALRRRGDDVGATCQQRGDDMGAGYKGCACSEIPE